MEFVEIVVNEGPGLCRCCLSEGCYKDLGSEYTWMNETEVYADMLLECFDISITQHDEGPNGPNRLICESCITKLRDAYNFRKLVLDSEKKFIDMMNRGEFRSKNNEENKGGSDSTVSDITVTSAPVKGKRSRKSLNRNEIKAKVSKVEEEPKTSNAVVKASHQAPFPEFHPTLLPATHWPVLVPATEYQILNRRQGRKLCVVCLKAGRKMQRTRFKCEACDVPLCIETNCFKNYHVGVII